MRKINTTFRLLLLLTFFCSTTVHTTETTTLDHIGSQVEQYPVVHADFTQTKKMAALKRPLITTGNLVYLKEQGVLWQIDKPFRIGYLLSDEKIIEIAADGVRKERGQRDVPGLAQIGRVFHAMLGANTAVLHEYFEVSTEGAAKKWRITLKPRNPQIAKFLHSMQISGGRFVETVNVIEAGGDTTFIRFYNNRGAKEASEADKQLFERK
jgi:hypothetical protein